MPVDTNPTQVPVSADGSDLPKMDQRTDFVVQAIRAFMRDYPELNRLIKGTEHSNRDIMHAIADTLDDFNTTPPFTSFGLSNFPSMSLFIRGCVCFLIESLAILQTRNYLPFSDGGIQIAINDKGPYWLAWLQLFRTAYEEKKTKIKVAYNIEAAWGGGIFSEYVVVNSFYGGW